jgi:hypothetical protein
MSIEARGHSLLPRVVNLLLARRRQPGRGVFVVAALLLALFALVGWEYGAFPLYAVLASICLLQAIRPTLLGWALVATLYAAGSAAYLYALVKDVIDIAGGNQASIFLTPGDGSVFILLVILLLAIDVALAIHRPEPLPAA